MADETIITDGVPSGAPSPPPSEDMTDRLQQELTELKEAFAGYLKQQKPELDHLRNELATATAQRDNTAVELARLQRQNQLEAISGKYGFNDVEYLDFVLTKNNIAPDDKNGVSKFMQHYKNINPRYFTVPVKAGSGSRPGSAPSNTAASGGRMDILEIMLSSAPEVF